MTNVSIAHNARSSPVPEQMRDRATQLDAGRAESETSSTQEAVSMVSACSLICGGAGLCIVVPVVGNVVGNLAGIISASVSLGLCCLGFMVDDNSGLPYDPNAEPTVPDS